MSPTAPTLIGNFLLSTAETSTLRHLVLLQMERILGYGSRLAIPAAILLAGAQRCARR